MHSCTHTSHNDPSDIDILKLPAEHIVIFFNLKKKQQHPNPSFHHPFFHFPVGLNTERHPLLLSIFK